MGLLNLSLSDSPLRAEHERIVRKLLTRGSTPPEERPEFGIDLGEYDAAALAAARRVWTVRMINEHQSAMVFTGLVPQLVEAEAPLEMKTTVLRMAMDELRHGALCAQVAEALGAPGTASVDLRHTPLPTHPGCTALERAARNAMFIGCLAETVAVAFTAEERQTTTEPLMRAVIDQICADESLHARFGWAFAKFAVPRFDDAQKGRTNRWLRVAFRYLEREEMLEVPNIAPPSGELSAQGLALGVCNNQETRELFYETIEQIIVPGLEALGLSAEEAWAHRASTR